MKWTEKKLLIVAIAVAVIYSFLIPTIFYILNTQLGNVGFEFPSIWILYGGLIIFGVICAIAIPQAVVGWYLEERKKKKTLP